MPATPPVELDLRAAMDAAGDRHEQASMSGNAAGLDVAILIPCYNEAVAIPRVVQDFRAALPQARIYVYDNNSSDDTASVAQAAGAIVRHEPWQGKGNV